MPITSYFHGLQHDPETERVMAVAYEMICATFQLDDQEPIDEAVARKTLNSPTLACAIQISSVSSR